MNAQSSGKENVLKHDSTCDATLPVSTLVKKLLENNPHSMSKEQGKEWP